MARKKSELPTKDLEIRIRIQKEIKEAYKKELLKRGYSTLVEPINEFIRKFIGKKNENKYRKF